jgi:hypothetical protein
MRFGIKANMVNDPGGHPCIMFSTPMIFAAWVSQLQAHSARLTGSPDTFADLVTAALNAYADNSNGWIMSGYVPGKDWTDASRDGARNDTTRCLLDGSATIRRPWLTPRSHSNRRGRKTANDAGVEPSGVNRLSTHPELQARSYVRKWCLASPNDKPLKKNCVALWRLRTHPAHKSSCCISRKRNQKPSGFFATDRRISKAGAERALHRLRKERGLKAAEPQFYFSS